jgi:hypothetical protein
MDCSCFAIAGADFLLTFVRLLHGIKAVMIMIIQLFSLRYFGEKEKEVQFNRPMGFDTLRFLTHISSVDNSLTIIPNKAIPAFTHRSHELHRSSFSAAMTPARDNCDKDPVVTQDTNLHFNMDECRVLAMANNKLYHIVCERRMRPSDFVCGYYFGGHEKWIRRAWEILSTDMDERGLRKCL